VEPLLPVEESAKVVLEAAWRIGKYRQDVRNNLFIFVPKTLRQELNLKESSLPEPKEKLPLRTLTAADRRVLEANETLAREIKPEEAAGILQLNEWRIAAGLHALEIDVKLCEASRDHSKDMATHGFFAHESPIPGKKLPWDRAKNFGTTGSSENIAVTSGALASNQAWFHSPGHHKNMFNRNMTHVGLGGHGRHWTQMFR
jgi:uncharacterized protein YkwD